MTEKTDIATYDDIDFLRTRDPFDGWGRRIADKLIVSIDAQAAEIRRLKSIIASREADPEITDIDTAEAYGVIDPRERATIDKLAEMTRDRDKAVEDKEDFHAVGYAIIGSLEKERDDALSHVKELSALAAGYRKEIEHAFKYLVTLGFIEHSHPEYQMRDSFKEALSVPVPASVARVEALEGLYRAVIGAIPVFDGGHVEMDRSCWDKIDKALDECK